MAIWDGKRRRMVDCWQLIKLGFWFDDLVKSIIDSIIG